MDDCTYHYFLSGNSVLEERNGSDQPIKDHLWGLTYVDEAVQTRTNTNLSSPSWTTYYHLQDANFNELGMVNATSTLVERYEYAAYGQRQVFTSAGSNDPGCYAPIFASKKVVIGSVSQPWGLNEVGHQGLLHDEQSGLVYNRARYLQPTLGRFIQQDPLGYVDGMNGYWAYTWNSISQQDPSGLFVMVLAPAAPAIGTGIKIVIGGGVIIVGGVIGWWSGSESLPPAPAPATEDPLHGGARPSPKPKIQVVDPNTGTKQGTDEKRRCCAVEYPSRVKWELVRDLVGPGKEWQEQGPKNALDKKGPAMFDDWLKGHGFDISVPPLSKISPRTHVSRQENSSGWTKADNTPPVNFQKDPGFHKTWWPSAALRQATDNGVTVHVSARIWEACEDTRTGPRLHYVSNIKVKPNRE
jgi:RHS repeat-associated protein